MRYDGPDLPNQPADPGSDRRQDQFYLAAWRRTFDFRGTSTRTEFWSFSLINAAIAVFLSLSGQSATGTLSIVLILVYTAFNLLTLIPSLSVTIRRVRDATGSGWVTLASFLFAVALFNPVIFLAIFACPTRDPVSVGQHPGGYWNVWRKTPDWLGVSNRSEFWPFTLINMAVLIGTLLFMGAVYGALSDSSGNLTPGSGGVFGTLVVLAFLAYFVLGVPWASLAARRVRDATGSGWWTLTAYIPFVGLIVLLVLFLLPSRNGVSSGAPRPGEELMTRPPDGPPHDPNDPWSSPRPGQDRQ